MSLYVSLAAAAASILIQPEKKGTQSNWKPDFSIASDRVFLLGIGNSDRSKERSN
jgi:hypothetical protein